MSQVLILSNHTGNNPGYNKQAQSKLQQKKKKKWCVDVIFVEPFILWNVYGHICISSTFSSTNLLRFITHKNNFKTPLCTLI